MARGKPSKPENPHAAALRRRVAQAPESPGVYRWLAEDGTVLYIGKAKNLRSRLRSYVQKPEGNIGPWKRSLMERIADMELTVTGTELEALILETNLIKEGKPKYNVLMKDDKNYVYVRVSVQDAYPGVEIVRRMEQDGAKYFGPFLSAYDTRKTLDVLQEILNFRENPKALERLNRAAKKGGAESVDAGPVLEFQIGQSCGVAMGTISREEYLARIGAVAAFFRGDRAAVRQEADRRMQEASQNRKFERAARLRDALRFIEGMEEQQTVSDTTGENTDTFAVAKSGSKSLVMLMRERGGRLIGEQAFPLQGEPDSAAEALREFLPQYYSSVPELPDTVVIGEEIEDRALLAEWLSTQRGKRVEIRVPERGKKSRQLELAERNAAERVKQLEAKWESAARNLERALAELQEALALPAPPKRIEGYDISHLGGTETVGSMVVMLSGKPANKEYRSFTIRTLQETEVDDYRALAEVLRRRLAHLTADPKALAKRWEAKGIGIGKALKKEQKAIEEIMEKNADVLSTDAISYRQFTVARKENAIIGCCRLFKNEGSILEIKSVWVHPKHRGQRLGQSVIRTVLAKLTKEKVYVTVDPQLKLEDYYAEMGFRHVLTPPPLLAEKTRKFCEAHPGAELGNILLYSALDNKKDSSLAAMPDLLVVDGGKGQLSAAVAVLKPSSLGIPVIGLAKREEEIFVPGKDAPLGLRKDSQAQFLLERLRNEAHRFANEHRKKRMGNHAFTSALDGVPGIGTKTRDALLLKFGSVGKIKEASDEELKGIVSGAQLRALRAAL